MTRITYRLALAMVVLASQIAIAQAPASAPAGATGLCNDGTYYNGSTKKGACRGHKGIKDWYGPAASTTAKTATTSSTPTNSSASSTPTGPPAGATGICNDGTYSTGASKQGACRGHKGVKEWYGAASSTAPSKTSQPATAPAPNPSSSASSQTRAKEPVPPATASGGGKGQVWLNTTSNVYHCEGSRFYGKTKAGGYMSEADAKAKGARPDHGKPCQ